MQFSNQFGTVRLLRTQVSFVTPQSVYIRQSRDPSTYNDALSVCNARLQWHVREKDPPQMPSLLVDGFLASWLEEGKERERERPVVCVCRATQPEYDGSQARLQLVTRRRHVRPPEWEN
jgi:hypothetical protein